MEKAPSPPGLRLGNAVRPTKYAVDLTLSPTEEAFSGQIVIDVQIARPTRVIWLNAKRLTISEARLDKKKLKVVAGDEETVGFHGRDVPAGAARLSIKFGGIANDNDTQGLFRQKSGEDWYLYSEFEPSDARKAFPCFDEPSFKVPWKLTLHVPSGTSAVSNVPVVSESEEGGKRRFEFAETKPLPSYLIAFGVGPFEYVDAGTTGMGKTPIRLVVPRGRSTDATYAQKSTAEILTRVEAYSREAYPYEKLDRLQRDGEPGGW